MSPEPLNNTPASDFERSVFRLDERRQAHFTDLLALKMRVNKENGAQASTSGSLYIRAFRESVASVIGLQDATLDEKVQMIGSIIKEESLRSAAFYMEHTACEAFEIEVVDPDTMNEILLEMFNNCDSTEEFIGHLTDAFGNELQEEGNHLAEHFEENQSEKLSMRRVLGGHALDVAKISVGVIVGAWFARKARIIDR